MARKKQLAEILNLRLDAPLAREIERVARNDERPTSEVAREFLAYGAEVRRRLDAQRLMEHHAATDDRPGRVEIDARWEPATDEEVEAMGL